jgi:hypothetical protein
MLLRSFKVTNYKGFRDTPPLPFEGGFTVIAGRNNAGKTALLEALKLASANAPHRSLASLAKPTDVPAPYSTFAADVELVDGELGDLLAQSLREFNLPPNVLQNHDAGDLLRRFAEAPSVRVRLVCQGGQLIRAEIPAFGLTDVASPQAEVRQAVSSAGPGQPFQVSAGVSQKQSGGLAWKLAEEFMSRIYLFRAERFNVGTGAFGPNAVLLANAANLPEALNLLQANPVRFDRFNRSIRQVLGNVGRVSVRPARNASNVLEIVVWPDDPRAAEREDLAVPLTESGTGIGQVLAMLYVVFTSAYPRTVLIDEPNSFLHPGAVQALLSVFREHAQHQYIIATHSPAVVSGTSSGPVLLLRKEEGETRCTVVRRCEMQELGLVLREVGATLATVFGANRILWVEGRTEELCFPLICERLLRRPMNGTAVVSVVNTGDFDGRLAKTTAAVYAQLSTGTALLPPAVAFIFDLEMRKHEDCERIRSLAPSKMHFLQRRCYENYLLNPHAIVAVLNELESFRSTPVAAERVQELLAEQTTGEPSRPYGGPFANQDEMLRRVDAPELLAHIFSKLSETKESFQKAVHSVQLTEWLIEHRPSDLDEVAGLLREVLAPDGTAEPGDAQ